MPLSISPAEAWQPLPASAWNMDAARHLLRRAGWSGSLGDAERALQEGLPATLDRLFPIQPALLAQPKSVADLMDDSPELARRLTMTSDEREKRMARREARERTQGALRDMSIEWLRYAAQPANAAFAKWGLFLGDVYVVGADKVKNTALVWQHADLIARHALGPAPALTKAVSRSPAMVNYLDLNQNRRDAPNENFARELFELFVLGEGHYTEADIKEAARAFTGYRQLFGTFRFAPRQSDEGPKTVFGQTGRFSGDDVIDLAYRQPAAATFLPREMVKFYLADTPLPPEHLETLGQSWREDRFGLRSLALRFFGSRLFFEPSFRGDFIKSPVQFYLGLVQDLQLDVAPLPRQVLTPLRQMGQMLYNPPNVRGWVGGRNWINSATLGARRQLVESLFAPIREEALNADEQADLVEARAAGAARFSVGNDFLAPFAKLDDSAVAERLLANFLALPATPQFHDAVRQFLANDTGANAAQRARRLRRAAIVLLQSPEYQLC